MIKFGKNYVEICKFHSLKEHRHIDINDVYIDNILA